MRPQILLGAAVALAITLALVLLLATGGRDGDAPTTGETNRDLPSAGAALSPTEDDDDTPDEGAGAEAEAEAAPSALPAAGDPAGIAERRRAAIALEERAERERTQARELQVIGDREAEAAAVETPPVEAPRAEVEAAARDRQQILQALTEGLQEEARQCTAQSRAAQTFRGAATLRVRVEETADGHAPRLEQVMGAAVEEEVADCYRSALDTTPFPPPDPTLDSARDGVRGYELWVPANAPAEE
ncbi:MAG: hypothetical protein EA398_00185 [Deltaproteobacteria bacterium]|nr:MAG: hypothetical protein EA398_00185 [Deltaproteobacteria bacterium]